MTSLQERAEAAESLAAQLEQERVRAAGTATAQDGALLAEVDVLRGVVRAERERRGLYEARAAQLEQELARWGAVWRAV